MKPADIGQLGTYVVAVDHTLRGESDNKTIGLLICKDKSEIVARYALASSKEPLGISSYELSSLVPENFKSSLPTIEEIESKAGEGLTSPLWHDSFSTMMKKRRKEVGMTQRRLAKMCKMSQPAIANIESGASSPNWDTIVKIPEALGLAIKFHNR